MAELAGKLNEVYILAGEVAMTSSTGAKISGVNNASWGDIADALEYTQFGDEYRRRGAGLKDTNISISGDYYTGDTNGQAVLVPGNFAYIGMYPEGHTVAGRQVKVLVTSFERSAAYDGKQTFTASVVACGAPVALPSRS